MILGSMLRHTKELLRYFHSPLTEKRRISNHSEAVANGDFCELAHTAGSITEVSLPLVRE